MSSFFRRTRRSRFRPITGISLLILMLLLLVDRGNQWQPPPTTNDQASLAPVTVHQSHLLVNGRPFEVRGINYLRSSTDDPVLCYRLQFGADGQCPWDLPAIQADLDQLQVLGVNTIRVFLNFYAFGGGSLVNPTYTIEQPLALLDSLIAEANQRGIYVLPVLLAKYPQDRFRPEDYELALELHVRPVVRHLAGRPGILGWDLFNEPDIGSPIDIRCWDWHNGDFPLCFPLANERKHFLGAVHAEVKRLDPDRLTTIGLAFAKNYFSPEGTDLRLADLVDFYTFHYYDNEPYDSGRYAAHWYYGQGFPADLQHAIGELTSLTPTRPVVITELGFPTDADSIRTSVDLQRDLRLAWHTIRAEQAQGMLLWPFQDDPEELMDGLFRP